MPATKDEVIRALKALQAIEQPEGDNEGDPLNAPNVYSRLSIEDQDKVDQAERLAKEYTRKDSDDGRVESPNSRSLTALTNNNFPASLSHYQYDPDYLVGSIEITDSTSLYIGDQIPNEDI